MADPFNPLNNPDVEPVSHAPVAREAPPEPDQEFEDFLDDIFETPTDAAADITPPPAASPPAPAERPRVESPPPSAALIPTPGDAPSAEGLPAPPASEPQDDAQRQLLERLNRQLDRMEPQEPAPQPTGPDLSKPDTFLEFYRPAIAAAVRDGWINEDTAALDPMGAALQIHMWNQIQQGGAQLQQTQEFTQAEQTRRSQEQATKQLDTAMDEVAGRGEIFEALKTDEVRTGFRDFLINELNPRLSQINADFLARQFYAYNHQLIFDTVHQQRESGGQQETASAAQLAQQEGTSARSAPSSIQQPEFLDLLEGTAAARWYQ